MADSNLLGDFLRARREQVRPEQVGLVAVGHRRVPGLRREEVATLAGISSDYYLRLEQGRDRNPSAQVVAALARALDLDATAVAYMYELADPRSPAPSVSPVVPESVERLIHVMDLPAFVQDRHYDVLATNRLAQLLLPGTVPGHNRVVSTFLHPIEREMFPDREEVTSEIVASFRLTISGYADDDRTRELVAELSDQSPEFRRIWGRQDIRNRVDRPPMHFVHPVVGEMTLTRDNFEIDNDGQRLMVWHAERGSDSYRKLQQLAATDREPADDTDPAPRPDANDSERVREDG